MMAGTEYQTIRINVTATLKSRASLAERHFFVTSIIQSVWGKLQLGSANNIRDFGSSKGFETTGDEIPLRIVVTPDPLLPSVFGVSVVCAVEILRIPGKAPQQVAKQLARRITEANQQFQQELSNVTEVEVLDVLPLQAWVEKFAN